METYVNNIGNHPVNQAKVRRLGKAKKTNAAYQSLEPSDLLTPREKFAIKEIGKQAFINRLFGKTSNEYTPIKRGLVGLCFGSPISTGILSMICAINGMPMTIPLLLTFNAAGMTIGFISGLMSPLPEAIKDMKEAKKKWLTYASNHTEAETMNKLREKDISIWYKTKDKVVPF